MFKAIFKITTILLAAFFLMPINTSLAQEQNQWKIINFNSDIEIEDSGQIKVTETIQADFSVSKHGIFRRIPLNYKNIDGSKHFTNIEVLSVYLNDKGEKYSTTKKGDDLEIKIGDPDKTISGNQTYLITYTVKGVLQSFDNHDELYWNVTGSNWPTDIENAQATVKISATDFILSSCYTGRVGQNTPCAQSLEPNLAKFSYENKITPGSDFTIAVSYPKNIIPVLAVSEQKTLTEKVIEFMLLANVFLIPIAPIITLITLYILWLRKGRDQISLGRNRPLFFSRSVTPEFTPPDNLRPAEIGILFDQKADTVDIAATVVDLAVRGHIKIKETKTNRSFLPDKTDYTLTKLNPKNPKVKLLPYEKILLDKLFETKSSVALSGLKNTFYEKLKKVKESAYSHMTSSKIFVTNPDKVRLKYTVIGFIMLFVGFFLLFWLSICGLVVIIFSQVMPRRTPYGFELFHRAKGYKEFIERSQKYPQKFFEDKNLFNEILPYAIMFGVVEKFSKAAKDMGLKPQETGWYSGRSHFNAAIFASNISAFSNSFSATSASRPGGSGSGGGGSSGGGFGGGGGGSW